MHRVIGERTLDETPFSADTARELLRDMVRARRFDERALALQRRGWMSGYPPFKGAEASQVGAAHAMDETDWLFPTYRSNAMQVARGVPMHDLLLFRRGFPEFTSGHDAPTFPQAVPIATQIPHAAGAAMAMDYRGDDHVALAYFGDGATSEGDFHEGLNFAGVFEAPVVFFCENNGWAISMPREKQTRSDSIAVKADAYGFDGVQVDGNDPLAILETVGTAIESARAGEPVLVESLTYRQGPHTTSDDPSRYEDASAYPAWRTSDPLDRYEEFLLAQGVIDGATRSEFAAAADEELDDAVAHAESEPEPSPDDVFDHAYAEPSRRLEDQRAWLHEHVERHGIDGVER